MVDAGLTAMSCREFVEVITDYLEHQMNEAERLWTEDHLAGCDACRNYLQQMRATIAALRGLSEEAVNEELLQRALAAFRAERPQR